MFKVDFNEMLAESEENAAELRTRNELLHDEVARRREAETALTAAIEQARSGSQAKSEFLANMSHEIRTPLNGILGMADLLVHTPLDQEQQSFLGTLRKSGDALLAVVNDILDFSKIENDMLAIEDAAFGLEDLLIDVERSFALTAREKGIDLSTLMAPDLPIHIRGDATRLRQVLVNLCGNALKFTNDGSVEVVVQRRRRTDGDRVEFAVIDTGIGIAPQHTGNLFEKFTQADNSTTRRFGGTGLGLAICRRLVELMGGTIEVDSELGQGSTFRFWIPLRQIQTQRFTRRVEIRLRGRRFLVVDAWEVRRERVRLMLARLGTQADVAVDLDDARNRLAAVAQWDLLIIGRVGDGSMPDSWPCPSLRLLAFDEEEADGPSADASIRLPCRTRDLGRQILSLINPEALHRVPPSGGYPVASAGVELPSFFGRRVLLVEDNAVNQKVTSTMLRNRGIDVDVAGNGAAALDRIEERDYDLVLMDLQMPVLDGLETTQRLRTSPEPRISRVPIVGLTASALQGDRERCIEAGMDDYLAKPVKMETMTGLLERLFASDLESRGD
ncbi:MAG: ATP-binding protein [Planctomycetota bacterium]